MVSDAFPIEEITMLVDKVMSEKLALYDPESKAKPFAEAVLTKEKVTTHSVVHSMLTSFGMSFYEQVSSILARPPIVLIDNQYKLLGNVPDNVSLVIGKIMNELRIKGSGRSPCKDAEVAEIRSLYYQKLPPLEYRDNIVDLRLVKEDGTEYLIDITTAKPNIKEVDAMKEKMLHWTAMRFSQDNRANVIAAMAIPYNPYEPEPYNRWTFANICELGKDVLVAEEFWNLVGQSDDTYTLLMDTLQKAGAKWKPIMDDFIAGLAQRG